MANVDHEPRINGITREALLGMFTDAVRELYQRPNLRQVGEVIGFALSLEEGATKREALERQEVERLLDVLRWPQKDTEIEIVRQRILGHYDARALDTPEGVLLALEGMAQAGLLAEVCNPNDTDTSIRVELDGGGLLTYWLSVYDPKFGIRDEALALIGGFMKGKADGC